MNKTELDNATAPRSVASSRLVMPRVKSNFIDHAKWKPRNKATNGQKYAFPAWKGKLKRCLNDSGVMLIADTHTLLEMWASNTSPTDAASRCREEGLVA